MLARGHGKRLSQQRPAMAGPVRCAGVQCNRHHCHPLPQGESGRASALTCYAEVLRRDARHAPAWRGLGDARREAGEHAEAVACYQVGLC